MSMLPDNIRAEEEAIREHDDFKKNTVGELMLTNEMNELRFPVKVFWFGPMLMVGFRHNYIRIESICPTHAKMYQARLSGEEAENPCEFCGVGVSFTIKGRK